MSYKPGAGLWPGDRVGGSDTGMGVGYGLGLGFGLEVGI